MRILATGTFDILHPGHLYYLKEAKKLGDELFVIVAREETSEKEIVIPERQRKKMVEGLKPVDKAVLGSTVDIFEPVEDLSPDILALGPDQDWDENWLNIKIKERGLDIDIVRIDCYKNCKLCSSSKIIQRILRLFA